MRAIKEYRLDHTQNKTLINFDYAFRLLKVERIDMHLHLLVEIDFDKVESSAIEVKHCLSNNVITEQDEVGNPIEFEYIDSVVVSSNRLLNFFYRKL